MLNFKLIYIFNILYLSTYIHYFVFELRFTMHLFDLIIIYPRCNVTDLNDKPINVLRLLTFQEIS